MNPLTNMKNVTKLSEQELQNNSKSSWHDQYRDSAWIFIGGLPYDLTEGDIICVFSQYGEVVNINLIRDKDSGKSKGFCFLCYEDQRSTVLAVDNFNGIKVLNRILRVDHVSEYKIPKEGKKTDEETKKLYNEGCAPKPIVPIIKNPLIEDLEFRRETLADQIQADIKLPTRLPIHIIKKEEVEEPVRVKTEKKNKKKKKKSRRYSDSEDEDKSNTKSKKKKKNPKKQRSVSESDSEDSIVKYRSQNNEGHVKRTDRSISIKNEMKRSRSRSVDKNEKQRSRFKRNRSREYDDISRARKNYEGKSSRKQSDSRRKDKQRADPEAN